MFKFLVAGVILALAAFFLLPIAISSGKKAARALFKEEEEKSAPSEGWDANGSPVEDERDGAYRASSRGRTNEL